MSGKDRIDLIWPEGKEREQIEFSEEVIEDLDLKKIFRTPDIRLGRRADFNKIFRSIMNKCTSEEEVIQYRLNILEDLMNCEELVQAFEEILSLVLNLRNIRDSQKKYESRLKNIVHRINELEIYVECIEELEQTFRKLSEPLQSSGIRKLRNKIEEISGHREYQSLKDELPGMRKKIESLRSITIGINLDAQLNPREAVLVSINEEPYTTSTFFDKLLKFDEDEFKGLASLASGDRKSEAFNKKILDKIEETMKSSIRAIVPTIEKYINVNTRFLMELRSGLLFYLSLLRLVKHIEKLGLPVCKPEVIGEDQKKGVIRDTYNINLAFEQKKEQGEIDIVKNDLEFGEEGRIFVLTGPNQGGKTTFTQAAGITQVLFQLGVYVPGSEAEISPVSGIYTHFPAEEKLASNLGRLGEECDRLKKIINSADENSLILLNESLASTSPQEALYIARETLMVFKVMGARVIFATHFHKLAENLKEMNSKVPGEAKIVSLVAGMDPDTSERTFEIKPGSPPGLSYARDVADKLGVNFEDMVAVLKKRGVIDGPAEEYDLPIEDLDW